MGPCFFKNNCSIEVFYTTYIIWVPICISLYLTCYFFKTRGTAERNEEEGTPHRSMIKYPKILDTWLQLLIEV